MKIIGISAKIGCGKTTVADLLLGNCPGTIRLAFGDPVKREASAIYGFPEALAYSESGKRSTVTLSDAGAVLMGRQFATVREILQYHGTELRRAQDPDYWVKAMDRALGVLRDNGVPAVVVDDVRFPEEAKLLSDLGGDLYRIEPYPGWEPGENAVHRSETALDDYDAWEMAFCPEKGKDQLTAIAELIASNSCINKA